MSAGAASDVVGTVIRPGDDANEFVFVTPDEQAVKTGEFIAYQMAVSTDGDGTETETVLARVTNREQARGLPEQFMANPGVAPDAVAETIGVPTEGIDLYRLTATVIGYYDDTMAAFRNPRRLPEPGTRLEAAPGELLEEVIPNVDPRADVGQAHVGWLLNRPAGAVDLRLPVDEIAATHLAILASTGSGKSYTAAVILEELLQPDSRAAGLVFDPHGEYDTLREMAGDDHAEAFQDATAGYTPTVNVVPSSELRVRIADLTFQDLLTVLDNVSNPMEQVLYNAWNNLQRADSDHITVDELKREVANVGDSRDMESSAGALQWRLDKGLGRPELFQPAQRDRLSDLLAPGQLTILQMDTLSRRDQQMLAAVLLRNVYSERVTAEQGGDSELPFPVFSLLEEAHRFAPDSGEARSRAILRTILSEGRKFGFGIGVISQRPSKIDADVLSQCGTQIIMQIQNPNDQDAIQQSIESAGEAVLQELPGLTPGQAVVAGDAVNTPVLCRVRERHTTHGAESPEATTEWRSAWEHRERDAADGTRPAFDHENSDIEEL